MSCAYLVWFCSHHRSWDTETELSLHSVIAFQSQWVGIPRSEEGSGGDLGVIRHRHRPGLITLVPLPKQLLVKVQFCDQAHAQAVPKLMCYQATWGMT